MTVRNFKLPPPSDLGQYVSAFGGRVEFSWHQWEHRYHRFVRRGECFTCTEPRVIVSASTVRLIKGREAAP